jgi:hypothetical protein
VEVAGEVIRGLVTTKAYVVSHHPAMTPRWV